MIHTSDEKDDIVWDDKRLIYKAVNKRVEHSSMIARSYGSRVVCVSPYFLFLHIFSSSAEFTPRLEKKISASDTLSYHQRNCFFAQAEEVHDQYSQANVSCFAKYLSIAYQAVIPFESSDCYRSLKVSPRKKTQETPPSSTLCILRKKNLLPPQTFIIRSVAVIKYGMFIFY